MRYILIDDLFHQEISQLIKADLQGFPVHARTPNAHQLSYARITTSSREQGQTGAITFQRTHTDRDKHTSI